MAGTGTRNSGWVSPRDITGTKARQLAAEKAARDKAEKPSQTALDAERLRGYDMGFDDGQQAFRAALVNLYKAEGLQAVEEFLQEETDSLEGKTKADYVLVN